MCWENNLFSCICLLPLAGVFVLTLLPKDSEVYSNISRVQMLQFIAEEDGHWSQNFESWIFNLLAGWLWKKRLLYCLFFYLENNSAYAHRVVRGSVGITLIRHLGYPEESKHLINIRYYYSEGLIFLSCGLLTVFGIRWEHNAWC